MSESKTKKPQNSTKPVETIRRGAIAASIWKRQASTGFEYLEFSLSRSWKLKSGEKEGYSQNFFETSEEALHDVIAEACDYIRAYEQARAQEREAAQERIDEAA